MNNSTKSNRADRDSTLLDEALAKFSGDFGSDKSAIEVAHDLRQGAEMVRDLPIENWLKSK